LPDTAHALTDAIEQPLSSMHGRARGEVARYAVLARATLPTSWRSDIPRWTFRSRTESPWN